jgi:hypothetical protein
MWRNGKNFPPKEGNSTIVAIVGTRHCDFGSDPVSMQHCAVARLFSGGPKVLLV